MEDVRAYIIKGTDYKTTFDVVRTLNNSSSLYRDIVAAPPNFGQFGIAILYHKSSSERLDINNGYLQVKAMITEHGGNLNPIPFRVFEKMNPRPCFAVIDSTVG